MKNILVRVGLFTGIPALLVWAVPIAVSQLQAKPFVGSFNTGGCACGHEIFYLIENDDAFYYCPGHREKRLVGPVSKVADGIEVSDLIKKTPDFRIRLEDGDFIFKFASEKSRWHVVEHVTNPWRTSLRWYLPE